MYCQNSLRSTCLINVKCQLLTFGARGCCSSKRAVTSVACSMRYTFRVRMTVMTQITSCHCLATVLSFPTWGTVTPEKLSIWCYRKDEANRRNDTCLTLFYKTVYHDVNVPGNGIIIQAKERTRKSIKYTINVCIQNATPRMERTILTLQSTLQVLIPSRA